MAITTTVKLRNGLVAADAYVRVDAFYGSKTGISYTANIYVSEEAFKGSDTSAPMPFIEQETFEFLPDSSPDAPHVWQQCYEHLLAQTRFADAVGS